MWTLKKLAILCSKLNKEIQISSIFSPFLFNEAGKCITFTDLHILRIDLQSWFKPLKYVVRRGRKR